MNLEKMEPIPPGSNPFHHDLFNMGQQIGKDLMLMFSNHSDEECKYLILVNTKTGERTKIVIEEENFSEAMNNILKHTKRM
jgi:hypothetical protein